MSRFAVIPLTIGLLWSACSPTLPVLHDKSVVTRTRSIVVLGVNWVETYYDLEVKEDKRRDGFDFYQKRSDTREKNKRLGDDDKVDVERLHLYNLKLSVDGSKNGDGTMRFYHPSKKFRKFQAYAMEAQSITPEYLYFTGAVLHVDKEDSVRFRDTVFRVKVPEAFTLSSEAGKIYYFGTVTLYIHTERGWFGLFPRDQVNKTMTVTGWETVDEFEEMKAYFEEHQPWFPIDEIENKTVPLAYKKTFSGWEIIDSDYLRGEEKRDKKNNFY